MSELDRLEVSAVPSFPPGTLAPFGRTDPLPRNLFHLSMSIGSIGLAAVLCQKHWSLPLYLLTVAWIGARIHALAILIHEGVHSNLARSRQWNDALAELISWPIFMSYASYRADHFLHHRFVSTDDDPDWGRRLRLPEWRFPKSRRSILGICARDLFGLNTLQYVTLLWRAFDPKRRKATQTRAHVTDRAKIWAISRIIFYVGAALWLTRAGGWGIFALYWLVPIVSWLKLIRRLRSVAEHFGIRAGESAWYRHTRTVVCGVLGRAFIAPFNVSYHLEHHFFPRVPWFELPRLHSRLMELPEYRAHAVVTRGYWAVVNECAGQPSSQA